MLLQLPLWNQTGSTCYKFGNPDTSNQTPDGTGWKVVYADGSEYEGSWKNGKADGSGTYKGLELEYLGDWKDNKPHGHGLMYYKKYGEYNGWFKNGGRDGYGDMTWSTGVWHYSGNWENDKVQGKGTFKCDNGSIYYGKNWSGSKINGRGTLRYSNGDRYEGDFVNGKRDGNGIYYPQKGKPYGKKWKKGKMVE